jgi:hypothetical protein
MTIYAFVECEFDPPPLRVITPEVLASLTADEMRKMIGSLWPHQFFAQMGRRVVIVDRSECTLIEAESAAEAEAVYAEQRAREAKAAGAYAEQRARGSSEGRERAIVGELLPRLTLPWGRGARPLGRVARRETTAQRPRRSSPHMRPAGQTFTAP